MEYLKLQNVIAALLYSFIGILIFVVSFVILDKATPYQLWTELVEKKNTALAVLVGAVMIGLSIIIAAAIHG